MTQFASKETIRCPRCQKIGTKAGFDVDGDVREPDALVRCPFCYLWFSVTLDVTFVSPDPLEWKAECDAVKEAG